MSAMTPMKVKTTNGTLLGGSSDVMDLPVTRVRESICGEEPHEYVVSSWRATFWQRLVFLFSGRIDLWVIGQTHAPIAVDIGNTLAELE